MKKIKLPFSLDEYNKGCYELECDNKEARMLCTDLNNDFGSIVCAIKHNDGNESVRTFREDGRYYIEKNKKYDLFLVKKQFEYGDILSNGKNTILVYNSVTRSGLPKHDIVLTKCVLCFGILDYTISGEAWNGGFGDVDEFRLANDSEKKTLFKELYKNNVYWNDEKKVIELNMEHEFHEFEKVIVRDSNDAKWKADFFSHIDETDKFPFICVGCSYKNCLPYNEYTKHLIGTTLND